MAGRVQKDMKKTILAFLIIVVFCAVVTSAFCLLSINTLRSGQLELTCEIAGKIAAAYPGKEEEIALSVLGGADGQALELGEKILQKYGYDSKLNVLDDIRSREGYSGIILAFFGFFAIVAAACLLLLIGSKMMTDRKLKELSQALDGMFENGPGADIREKEGMIGVLYSQLVQIAGRSRLTIGKLNREKENVQALVTDISHQVKTPLSSIKLFNAMLLNGDADETETKVPEQKP